MKLQITRSGVIHSITPKELKSLRATYNKQYYLHLPKLFEPFILRYAQRHFGSAANRHLFRKDSVGSESRNNDLTAEALLHFLMNNQALFRLIQSMTGCRRIEAFGGRIYHLVPGEGHYVRWHADMIDNRLVAMSVNLSQKKFEGAILKIRGKKPGGKTYHIQNTAFGDAVIFRIAPHLEHCLTDITGKNERSVYSGWFHGKTTNAIYLNKVQIVQRSKKNKDSKLLPIKSENLDIIKIQDKVSISKRMSFQKTGENTLLFNIDSRFYCQLESVGSRIWDLLVKERNLRSVITRLSKEYDAPLNVLSDDVLKFCRSLHHEKFIDVKH